MNKMKVTIFGLMFLQLGVVFGMQNIWDQHFVQWEQSEEGIFSKAIQEDNVGLFQTMIMNNPALLEKFLDLKNFNKWNSFSKIAHCNSCRIVELLMTSPNLKEKCMSHAATLITYGSAELVQLLVNNGLDVNGTSVVTTHVATYASQPESGFVQIADGLYEVRLEKHNLLWVNAKTADIEREKAKISVLLYAGANPKVVDAQGLDIWDLWALSPFNDRFGKDKARVIFLLENGVAVPEKHQLKVNQILNR